MRSCFLLTMCAAALFAIGLVMIFNTTSAEILDHDLARSTSVALVKQLLYGAVGVALAAAVRRFGYHAFIQWSPVLLIGACLLLIMALLPGVGREVNGSRRWVGIGGLTIQPSEGVKLIVPAFFLFYLKGMDGINLTLRSFLKLIGILLIPVILILVEPNNGTAGVIVLTILIMCIVTKIPSRFWVVPLVSMMIVGAVSAAHLPYVSGRIHSYLNPELDLHGKGHQPYQAKIAAGSGRLIGRGPGKSLQKMSYLPEAQNDYIAAIYAEEFGFVGMSLLILLYMLLGYAGFSIAFQAADASGAYLATSIAFLLSFQAFMNLGVVSGLLPSTGLNLPLFSQGGSSLMMNIVGLGLLLNIGREGPHATAT